MTLPTYDTSRGIIAVTGEDRVPFLQGILTQDVSLLTTGRLLFSALLTPQGKLAHDFFLWQADETIYLDTPRLHKDALLQRLKMYILRAKVSVADRSDDWRLFYVSNGGFADPRHREMPHRFYTSLQEANRNDSHVSVESYHTHRLALGIPESPYDTTSEDVAMDLGYDLLGAISFSKGCYVGQEVTARMHYKQIARRGFFIVTGNESLPAPGSAIVAGTTTLSGLRSVHKARGLALIKFEAYEAAINANQPFLVDNKPVDLTAPAWLAPKLAQFRANQENQ